MGNNRPGKRLHYCFCEYFLAICVQNGSCLIRIGVFENLILFDEAFKDWIRDQPVRVLFQLVSDEVGIGFALRVRLSMLILQMDGEINCRKADGDNSEQQPHHRSHNGGEAEAHADPGWRDDRLGHFLLSNRCLPLNRPWALPESMFERHVRWLNVIFNPCHAA